MAGGAFSGSIENFLAALRGFFLEGICRRFGCGNSELIKMKRRELGSDQVRFVANIAEAVARGDRELRGVRKALIEEITLAVHFEIGDESVPVSDRAPTRPGVQVDARQTKRGGNQHGRGLSVRAEGFAVEKQFSIEVARPPAIEHFAYRGLVGTEKIGKRLEVGCKRHNRADI